MESGVLNTIPALFAGVGKPFDGANACACKEGADSQEVVLRSGHRHGVFRVRPVLDWGGSLLLGLLFPDVDGRRRPASVTCPLLPVHKLSPGPAAPGPLPGCPRPQGPRSWALTDWLCPQFFAEAPLTGVVLFFILAN